MELLLIALGGCTGMDVINILGKQRSKVTSLRIDLAAEQAVEYPRAFTKVTMTYRIGGEDLDEASVRRAIDLSDATYCSVAATLRLPVSADWKMELVGP